MSQPPSTHSSPASLHPPSVLDSPHPWSSQGPSNPQMDLGLSFNELLNESLEDQFTFPSDGMFSSNIADESNREIVPQSSQDWTPPSPHHPSMSSLLLGPGIAQTPQSALITINDHDSLVASAEVPRIRINTSELASPAQMSPQPYYASSPNLFAQSAYATPSTSFSGSPYLPQTPIPVSPLMNPIIVDPSYRSPHSPYSQHTHLRTDYFPMPKSPYNPHLSPSMDYPLHSPEDQVRPRHTTKTVTELALEFSCAGVILPQRTYRPHTQSDRRRYVEEVELEHPIMFYTADGCGISCKEALNSKFARLKDRDDAMFINRGPSVSIRLMWPGYAPWSRQIPTRDFRTPPGPITKAKLAKNVAKTIVRFIEETQGRPLEEEAEKCWRVGPRFIKMEDIEIIGLQHVSMGSWQAHLRIHNVQRPNMPHNMLERNHA